MPKIGDKVRLTDRYVTALRPEDDRSIEVLDAVQRGLALRVRPSGIKAWCVRKTKSGTRVRVDLGQWPAVGLAEARQKAAEALAAIESGRNPNEERRAERRRVAVARERAKSGAPTTARELIEARAKARAANGTARSWPEERRALLTGLAPLLDKPLTALDAGEVMKRVRRLHDRGSPVSANRLAQYGRALFAWARDEDFPCGVDPAALRKPAPEKPRERVLRDDELRAVWAALRLFGARGQLYRMAFLTGQRRGELAAMAWDQIEDAAGVWHVPVTKSGRSHLLPLSRAMRRELDAMDGPRSGLVFRSATKGPIGSWGKPHVAIIRAASIETQRQGQPIAAEPADPAKAPPMANWTIHDIRRTAATLLGRAGTRPEIIERILGHAHPTGGALASVYQRWNALPEMLEALDNLARLLGGIVGEDLTGEGGVVVPFPVRA